MRKFTPRIAVSVVIANMIGTGVFTSLGFQLQDITAAPVILVLWLVGGVLALCGALCYAELGAALPRSGGEYHFIGAILHPGAGFVAGWVSATIGFAAPTALAAITAATYLAVIFDNLHVPTVAVGLVAIVTAAHLFSRRSSGEFQFVFTALKVVLVVGFIVGGIMFVPEGQQVRWSPLPSDAEMLTGAGFAVALVFVNYAYTGWNAATYLVGEMTAPQRNLPRVLLIGTVVVTALYLLLHVMFLYVAPMSAMQGELEIGYVVARFAFGEQGSLWVAGVLGILLVSTVSAMTVAGPRTLQVMGEDIRLFRWLAKVNADAIPYRAILFQTSLTVILILTASFRAILLFAGFTLALNTLLTVAALVLHRHRGGIRETFRMPWYPWPVVIYATIMTWTLVLLAAREPREALFGAAVIASGWLFYLLARDRVRA